MTNEEMRTTCDIVINDKKRVIFCEYTRPALSGSYPCVVMGHGYGGHRKRPYMQTVKSICHEMKIATVAFDLTGCGLSDGCLGNLTPKAAKNDWKSVVSYAARLPDVDASKMIGFGNSFSGNALLEFAAEDKERHLKELIAHVPVPKWKKVVEFALQAQLMLKGKDLKKIDEDAAIPVHLGDLELHVSSSLIKQLREMNLYKNAAPHIRQPVTIIGAEEDELVKPKKLWKLQKCFPEKTPVRVEIIEKARHSFNDDQLDQMGEIVRQTLEKAFPDRAAQTHSRPLLYAV